MFRGCHLHVATLRNDNNEKWKYATRWKMYSKQLWSESYCTVHLRGVDFVQLLTTRLNSFLRRCHKLGYTDKHYSDISTMFQEADDALFRTILSNTSHVLHTFVSERPDTTYSLRTRSHNKLSLLIPKTSDLGERHFIIRSLYKNLYWCDYNTSYRIICWYCYIYA